MGLFSSRSALTSYLGVDLGFGGVKMVELANEKARARLVTYAYANLPTEGLEKSMLSDIPATVSLIKKMLAKARTTTKKTISVLPISSVFSSILIIPTTDDKELKDAVAVQAKKLVPLPLEEVSLDTKVIEKIEKSEGVKASSRVLVTAAPKTLVAKYLDIFKQAGLELVSLETEAFAEIRALVGKDRSTMMIVDIGSLRTNVIIVERGIPFVTRSIAAGGDAMTQTIAKTLGIPLEQAETMKRDIKAMQSFTPTGDLFPILSVLLKPILDEVRYSLNQYQQQNGGTSGRIEKIILTGGSSLLPRLPEFLTKEMNVNTYLGNPWARVIYPPELRPVLDEIGTRMAVSIGCAMREIES
ncbi:MAG: type IV pilus assembly protein PilM [Candidatus Uhrbacteria bacterium]|nr:type IV pilus assembly protein PilM [Candidatus Uhrbacteria bacterium]MDP3793240.1 type IV pilus assembly protein PilM [Candidatus Uhrbacteria bacterium]